MIDKALYLTINSLFEAGQYEDVAALLVKAMDKDIEKKSIALDMLWSTSEVQEVLPGTIYSRRPTRIATDSRAAIKATDEIAKPLHICCRPAFEIGKPIDSKRLDNLLSAMRTAIDRLLLVMIRATSATLESDNAIDLFEKARTQFGTGIFSIYSGADFGTEFSYATRSVPHHKIENSNADGWDKVLNDDEILFISFPRATKAYGSIYLGPVQNVTAPGLDPKQFPAIKYEEARSYGDNHFEPAISFSIVLETLLTIADPETFITGRVL